MWPKFAKFSRAVAMAVKKLVAEFVESPHESRKERKIVKETDRTRKREREREGRKMKNKNEREKRQNKKEVWGWGRKGEN